MGASRTGTSPGISREHIASRILTFANGVEIAIMSNNRLFNPEFLARNYKRPQKEEHFMAWLNDYRRAVHYGLRGESAPSR